MLCRPGLALHVLLQSGKGIGHAPHGKVSAIGQLPHDAFLLVILQASQDECGAVQWAGRPRFGHRQPAYGLI